jgi:putative phosphoesterase
MKIAVTADLHWGLRADGDRSTRKIAREILASGADVLALAGDTADFFDNRFLDVLGLFWNFRGPRLLVAGNHDLWRREGDSFEFLTNGLAEICRKTGFHYLEEAPFVLGKVGFVGSVGWYDYSYRDKSLRINEVCYREKTLPGVVEWNDRNYIRWDLDDVIFTNYTLKKLECHLKEIDGQVEKIVAITHHVPFFELLEIRDDTSWAFTTAFMGSRKLGELFLRHKKVKYSFCGHSHIPKQVKVGRIKAINVGSDYKEKRVVIMDI